MWSSEVTNMIIAGIGETLYMTLVSTIAGYIIGLPMGIVLTVSDKDGIRPNSFIYKILDVIVNIVRSIPFIILLVLLIPFTRLSGRKKLWFHCNHRTAGSGSSTLHCANGGVFPKGSGCRSDRGSQIYGSVRF